MNWTVFKRINIDLKLILAGSMLLLFFVVAFFISPFIEFDPMLVNLSERLAKPSWIHILGCDALGRDVFLLIVKGSQTSLSIATAATLTSVSLGTVLGLISGYCRGWVDAFLMRIADIFMAFPGILLTMAIAAFLQPSSLNIILAITVSGWTSFARIIRGEVLRIQGLGYVDACKIMGASHFRILAINILPNCLTPLIIATTFSIASVIITESSLSFLGLTGNHINLSWGALLAQGKNYLTQAPHLSLAPGISILFVVLAINIFGDALRDSLDPHDYKKVKN